MSTDRYRVSTSLSEGLYKDKGSKFIAYALPVSNQEDIKNALKRIRNKEHAARHFCYAYTLGSSQEIQKESDDGEPKNSAGKPILRQLLSSQISNTIVIVVRYFGGVKLGVGGLISAYKGATLQALEKINTEYRFVKSFYKIDFHYKEMNNVMRIVKEHKLNIIDRNFEESCSLTFSIRQNQASTINTIFEQHHKIDIQFLKTE